MRLTDHIHLVGSGSSGLYLTDAFDAHVYLVAGARGSVLIDAAADATLMQSCTASRTRRRSPRWATVAGKFVGIRPDADAS